MIYQHLFGALADAKPVRVGLIGAGQFGAGLVAQSSAVPLLHLTAIAETDADTALQAYAAAGYDGDHVRICDTRKAALQALEAGKRIVVEDSSLLMDLPLDVIAEATGNLAAGARHALQAIAAGKHVAMISKEVDVTVGPILHHRARQAGLVYSPVDGDQHGLLIGLFEWCRGLGLEVLCGGKARDLEFVYDPVSGRTGSKRQQTQVPIEDIDRLDFAGSDLVAVAGRRAALLSGLQQVGNNDITEMAIIANATGLMPDIPATHHPALHTREIAEFFAPAEDGGALSRRGVVDCVTSLHREHEPGLGGGVFVTVACDNDHARDILTTKGLLSNRKGNSMLIYRPYHLLGVEAIMTLLCAGLLGIPTGSGESVARVDMVAVPKRTLRLGETVGGEKSPELAGHIVPASSLRSGGAVPFYLAEGRRLIREVPAGRPVMLADVEAQSGSDLWTLRHEQDLMFLA